MNAICMPMRGYAKNKFFRHSSGKPLESSSSCSSILNNENKQEMQTKSSLILKSKLDSLNKQQQNQQNHQQTDLKRKILNDFMMQESKYENFLFHQRWSHLAIYLCFYMYWHNNYLEFHRLDIYGDTYPHEGYE